MSKLLLLQQLAAAFNSSTCWAAIEAACSCATERSSAFKAAEAWSCCRGNISSQGSSQLLRKLIKALQLLLFHLVKLDVVLVSILLKAQGALWAGLNSSAEALIKVLRPLSKNHLLKARRAWSSDSVQLNTALNKEIKALRINFCSKWCWELNKTLRIPYISMLKVAHFRVFLTKVSNSHF